MNRSLLRAGVFCVALSASRRFFWAIKNCFQTIFQIFHHKAIWGGQKVTRHGKKKVKHFSEFFFLNQGPKRNKKMGGRSHVITFGVFLFKMGHSSVHCTVLLFTVHISTMYSYPEHCQKSVLSTSCCPNPVTACVKLIVHTPLQTELH